MIVWRSNSSVSGLSKFNVLLLLLLLVLSLVESMSSVRTDIGGDERDDGGEAMVDVQCQERDDVHWNQPTEVGPLVFTQHAAINRPTFLTASRVGPLALVGRNAGRRLRTAGWLPRTSSPRAMPPASFRRQRGMEGRAQWLLRGARCPLLSGRLCRRMDGWNGVTPVSEHFTSSYHSLALHSPPCHAHVYSPLEASSVEMVTS